MISEKLNKRERASAFCIYQNKVLTVVLKCPKSGEIYVLPPGGKIEAGELPYEAATRETLEETGFQIKINSLQSIRKNYIFTWDGKVNDVLTHFYVADLVQNHNQKPDADYIIDIKWLSFKEALDAFSNQPETKEAFEALVLAEKIP